MKYIRKQKEMKIVRFKKDNKIYYGSLENNEISQWTNEPWLGGKKLTLKHNFNTVELLAPCHPRKIIATAINFPGVTGSSNSMTEALVFIKPATSVIGPNETIISPFKILMCGVNLS